jgi:hypothetical protein
MTAAEKIEVGKMVATLVAAIIVFAGGFFTYAYQRRIDRGDKLREKKQAAYEAYLHRLYAAAMERNRDAPIAAARVAVGKTLKPDRLFSNEEKHDLYQEAKLSVFVMASDLVVRAAGSYQKMVEVGSMASGEQKRVAFAELIRAMREDSFNATGLTVEEIANLSPIIHR